ncbi:unnamed protein product [Parajaminaea phylloscopi]
MDFDDIGNRIANLTFYDLKSAWTQAKNYALNVSEIEAKVNEATSDDPWGASSTLMQEIAQATNNFADFNEIMPAIFRNFMEREANEWRQIYKSLQLLEYIVKHGSERVVDDARAHLGTVKILRNFHYIDEAGKDQGLNVRNRAKELAEMLSDVDRIRQERRKARANRTKYQGAGNSDFVPGSGGGRYGGFGSDSFYAGGGFSGEGESTAGRYPAAASGGARESFDEYDAGDDDVSAPPSARSTASASTSRRQASSTASQKRQAPQQQVADLFSFDDDEPAASAVPKKHGVAGSDSLGDDFDDFQAAPVASATTTSSGASKTASAAKAAPAPSASKGNNVFDFLDDDALSGSAPAPAPKTAGQAPAKGLATATSALSPPLRPSNTSSAPAASIGSTPGSGNRASSTAPQQQQASSKTASGLSGFDDLWSSSSGSANKSSASSGKKTMADLAKEQSGQGVWGASAGLGKAAGSASGSGSQKKDLFDLL